MNVFIVDDSKPIRVRVKSDLTNLGITVVGEAETANDAVDRILKVKPDVVTLDLWLSQGSGLYVLREIKSQMPSVVVMIFTNRTSEEYRQACFNEGADYYFEKTKQYADATNLLKCLNELHEQAMLMGKSH